LERKMANKHADEHGRGAVDHVPDFEGTKSIKERARGWA
jgi:hypothetical protein